MDKTYCIVRFFQKKGKEYLPDLTGLTLEEAKEHCDDPETSWQTCEEAENVARTEQFGPWFDGFEEE